MAKTKYTFERKEKKYLLDAAKYQRVMRALGPHLRPDEYAQSTVCSVYYDTPDFELIRTSLEKPTYKEKLRVRSYGVPAEGDEVFVELKKKYKGVVFKRRMTMGVDEATNLASSRAVTDPQTQVEHEVAWFMQAYENLAPACYVAYDRLAFVGRADSSLRVTFDRNVRARDFDLDLAAGDYGEPLLPEGHVVMEIKARGAMPLWLVRTLSNLEVYPGSFSKYGTFYKRLLGAAPNVVQVPAAWAPRGRAAGDANTLAPAGIPFRRMIPNEVVYA